MIYLACDPAHLSLVGEVAHCSQWVAMPVSGFAAMTNSEFNDLLSACMKLALAGFFVWWLVWAARRF